MKADATLVNAAYKMGMANVPHDTSRIFQQQYAALAGIETAKIGMYGDIAKSVGNVIGKGIETYAQIKDVEQRKEWNQKYDDLAIDHLFETAQTWDDHFQKKQGIIDDDTKKHAEKEITAIKDEIQELESDPMFIELQKGARTDSQIKKVSELRQKVAAWRNESNELLGGIAYHNNLWKNLKVDKQTSFRTQNKETGEWEVRADLASLYNHVMNPAIKLGDVNIERMRHPKTGQIGYSFNPKDDRLAQTYKLLKNRDSIDVDKMEKIESGAIADESRTSWISHDELMSMVRPKDDWVSTSLTGEMTEILSSADQTKAVYTRNADGTLTKSKNVQYNVNDYSDIASKAENRFFDVLMSTSQDDGQGGQMARDPQQGIIYLSNNKWLLGNTTIDYNEHSKSNPSISALSYSDLGLSGSVDADGNNIIDTDELTDEDKEIVRNRLMRPQTQQETVIAARELARYCSLQTKGMFDNNRGNVRATVVGGGGGGGAVIDTDTDSDKNPFGKKSLNLGGGNWLSPSERWRRRKIIESGKGGFTGVYGEYAISKDGNTWTVDDGSGPKPIDTYRMMQDERLLIPGDVDSSTDDPDTGGGGNPFGETQANRAPADFIAAVGKDDKDVVTYLENMGVTVKNLIGDRVEVEINGKKKTFTVDPNVASDEARANEMWKWMFKNWRSGTGKYD